MVIPALEKELGAVSVKSRRRSTDCEDCADRAIGDISSAAYVALNKSLTTPTLATSTGNRSLQITSKLWRGSGWRPVRVAGQLRRISMSLTRRSIAFANSLRLVPPRSHQLRSASRPRPNAAQGSMCSQAGAPRTVLQRLPGWMQAWTDRDRPRER